jgi:hypothetical protein
MSNTTLQGAPAPDSLDRGAYLEQRVRDQIDWYGRKGRSNQRWFKLLRVVEIAAAALIPFLTAVPDVTYMKYVIGGLGVLITVVAGLLALFQFQERWTEYRTTGESLKRERFLFLTKAEPYAGADGFSNFVQRIETLISKENVSWAQSFVKPDKGKEREA